MGRREKILEGRKIVSRIAFVTVATLFDEGSKVAQTVLRIVPYQTIPPLQDHILNSSEWKSSKIANPPPTRFRSSRTRICQIRFRIYFSLPLYIPVPYICKEGVDGERERKWLTTRWTSSFSRIDSAEFAYILIEFQGTGATIRDNCVSHFTTLSLCPDSSPKSPLGNCRRH